MKKQRRMIALLLTIIILLPMAACGSTAAAPQQDMPNASEAEIVADTTVKTEAAPTASVSEETDDTPQEEPDTDEADETEENAIAGESIPDSIPDLEEFFASEPFIPEDAEKIVFPPDNRVDIAPREYPFRCIAYMEVKGQCGCSWTSSGFMVSKYGLLTSGHSLVCKDHNKPNKSIAFYFGYRSKKDCLYKYSGQYTYWYGDGSFYGSHEDDYGYILFPKPVGDNTGWLGLRVLSDSEAMSDEFYNAGYRNGVIKASGMGDMFPCGDSSKLFQHYMDTEGGYSGSPIYDVECYAVGIHVAESYHGEYNLARRITWDLIDQMDYNGLFKK